MNEDTTDQAVTTQADTAHAHITETARQRPRWARVVHNLGDDLRWAITAWCDFPRPARRVAAAVCTTAAAHTFGAGDAVEAIITAITG